MLNSAYRTDFLAYWDTHYPETPPIGYLFKQLLPKRWARIHSLPDSKRYADTDEEWACLLHRQNRVIGDLVGDGNVVQIVIDHIEPDNHLFQSENLHDIGVFSRGQDEPVHQCYAYETTWDFNQQHPLLLMIADETMRAFIIGPDCLIAPYAGGMDLIFKDPHTTWEFKRKYQSWLSPRADGF
jgi:hypothetical protein